MNTPVGIGLGSNLGDRPQMIDRAIRAVSDLEDTRLVARSRLYTSPPWGVTDQPEFLNAAALVMTGLKPYALLHHLKAIEQKLGRIGGDRWGPRAIDLDILFYGSTSIDDETLSVPHKALFDRAFVLVPLAEIGPDLLIDGQNVKRAAAVHPDSPSILPYVKEG